MRPCTVMLKIFKGVWQIEVYERLCLNFYPTLASCALNIAQGSYIDTARVGTRFVKRANWLLTLRRCVEAPVTSVAIAHYRAGQGPHVAAPGHVFFFPPRMDHLFV